MRLTMRRLMIIVCGFWRSEFVGRLKEFGKGRGMLKASLQKMVLPGAMVRCDLAIAF